MKRFCAAVIIALVLGSCATPFCAHTVYVCSQCGEAYYGMEDAQECHNALVILADESAVTTK